jgi:tRNA(Ile)-lysidine synthase
MNFFRGTGLEGLTGMPSTVPHIRGLRPLLHNTRKQIEDYAQQNNLRWVEDSSNESIKYTRNFFRHQVIPAIQKPYPQAEENVLNNISRFQKINELYRLGVDEIKQKACKTEGSELHIIIAKLLLYQHTALAYEIIRGYGFGEKQVEEVYKLCKSESGKFIESASHQIIRHRNKLIIAPIAGESKTIAADEETNNLVISNQRVSFRIYSKDKWQLNKSTTVAQLDAD